jgi:hypothetical protein
MRCFLIVAVTLSACRAPAAQAPGRSSGLICHTETPTGTAFSREICRTPEQIEDERKRARELLEPRGGRQTVR